MFIRHISIYLVTGIILLTLSHTCAAPNVARRAQQFDSPISKGPLSGRLSGMDSIRKSYENAISNIADMLKLYPAKVQHLKSINQLEPRQALETLIGPSIDSATNLLIAVSNFINGRTNIATVDKYMNSFRTLMTSNGLFSTVIYSNMFMGFATIYDAVASIFRTNEDRYKRNKELKKEALNEDNEAVEEMISTLNVANERLNTFKKSLLSLICEKIDRSAMKDGKILIKRSGLERQIDCSSLLLKRVDTNNNNEKKEEDKVEVNKDDEDVDGENFENPKEILKEDVIPDEPNDFSYSKRYDNEDETNDNEPEAVEQNYEENVIPDSF